MKTLVLEGGPWLAVLVDGDGSFKIHERGFESRDQVETFLRKNHSREWRSGEAFAFDMRNSLRAEDKVGEFKTFEEVQDFVARFHNASKTKQ